MTGVILGKLKVDKIFCGHFSLIQLVRKLSFLNLLVVHFGNLQNFINYEKLGFMNFTRSREEKIEKNSVSRMIQKAH